MTKRHLGVDLSHWQGEGGLYGAKWDKLVKCDVRWAILKATQGTGHIDNAFAANLRRARKRGLEVGAYHFLIRGIGRAQAQHFIRTVKRANGGKLKDVLLVVDVERDPGGHSPPAPRTPEPSFASCASWPNATPASSTAAPATGAPSATRT